MTYALQLTRGIGGCTGRLGEMAWVAKITGTDPLYGLARAFCCPDKVEARDVRILTFELGPGLYERSKHGERGYLIVWEKADGSLGCTKTRAERVQAMATLMDDGQDFEAARRATKPPAPPQPAGEHDGSTSAQ